MDTVPEAFLCYCCFLRIKLFLSAWQRRSWSFLQKSHPKCSSELSEPSAISWNFIKWLWKSSLKGTAEKGRRYCMLCYGVTSTLCCHKQHLQLKGFYKATFDLWNSAGHNKVCHLNIIDYFKYILEDPCLTIPQAQWWYKWRTILLQQTRKTCKNSG